MRWFARCAFFLSGVAGLIFEIVWLRHLGLAVGATTLAVATTTAAYMGGLALGSHFGGRLSDRLRRPLAVYGGLELVIAALGALVPLLTHLVPRVDELIFADMDSGVGRALVRFLVAAVVLLGPTTAMGMTLPVLARAVTVRVGNVGREVGALYAINIAGAVVGAGLAGFYLIPSFGLSATNGVAVAFDLVLGVAALAAGLTMKPLALAEPTPEAPVLRAEGGLIVSTLAITGAAAMVLQVLWTRALGTALGPSTYAFSAIVCAYLIGLALGGSVASRVADGVQAVRGWLAGVLVFTALAVFVGVALVDDLPLLLHPIVLDEALTMGGLVRTEFFLAALSLLPATAGMGAIFPLTLSAVVGSEARLGAAVGRAYAVNTLGNIIGSFAGVFVLLPLFGVEWGMRVGALAYVAVAALLIVKIEPSVSRKARLTLTVGATVAALCHVAMPSWDVARWTLGLYRLSMARQYFPDPGDVDTSRVIFHADGMASTVTVEQEGKTRWIKVNGKIDGSSEGDMPTQVLSGTLPMLVHPAPKQVAVIGCGSCVTVGAALRANPDKLTLVELEPEVVRAARLFDEVNHAPWNDPRLVIVEDDGRNFMMRKGTRFDVIISEPSNPWMTGAASLFTREFFAIAQGRMEKGGVFLQWLQAYELAPERIASVLKTFQSVFPHVLVFSAHPDSNDLLLLGSREPLRLERAHLTKRIAELAPELARAEVQRLEDLLALLLLTSAELDKLPASVQLNTDDNALIEFGAPRDLLTFAESDPDLKIIDQTTGLRAAMVKRLGGIGDDPAEMLDLAWGYLRRGMVTDAEAAAKLVLDDARAAEAQRASALEATELAGLLGEDEDRAAVIDGEATRFSNRYMQAAKLVADGEAQKALAHFESALPETPIEKLLYAYLLYKDGRYGSARGYLQSARREPGLAKFQVAISYYLARASYYDGMYARAVTEMQRYRELLASFLAATHEAD